MNSLTTRTLPLTRSLTRWLRPTALRPFSRGFSTAPLPSYAAVDHSEAYERAMQGGHGQQLALAALEGYGKDEPDFDPFIEEEMAEDGQEDEEDEDSGYYDDDEGSGVFNSDGSLRRAPSELATLRAGAPAGGMVAVIELAGTQYKVTTDDLLIVNKLKPVEKFQLGSVHSLDSVLLLSTSHYTLVGLPKVEGAVVDVMVEEITKDAKVIIFKKRRRKHSQRKNGFRREVTMLRVLDIRPPEPHQKQLYQARPPPTLPSDN
ncbi:hypothetical protein FisN_25Hh108 [Fistulifera solaris]|uniref:Large ribosomal subunit protein bL21m n=1 Tax=Fistulifera solaris TaxID=1519565 RepID=A0A1Z5JW56_FISSO|nr:hypothetical protein FisN_25Hh108 [Fistulifera solaris]|eukprot:GAX18126.1 hypothetical protein FisN_25Hh108 [Fistulifera solaris]